MLIKIGPKGYISAILQIRPFVRYGPMVRPNGTMYLNSWSRLAMKALLHVVIAFISAQFIEIFSLIFFLFVIFT